MDTFNKFFGRDTKETEMGEQEETTTAEADGHELHEACAVDSRTGDWLRADPNVDCSCEEPLKFGCVVGLGIDPSKLLCHTVDSEMSIVVWLFY